jgi:hypothetical protein
VVLRVTLTRLQLPSKTIGATSLEFCDAEMMLVRLRRAPETSW